MGKKKNSRARETEEGKAAMAAPSVPVAKKRKNAAADASGAAGICDDVLDNIFARLPTRSAVASLVLSKQHQALICSPEFRRLHFRLGAPMPDPHIAYITSEFHGFQVAGAGHKSDAPMRTLDGERYPMIKYINTCNGVVLLARDIETAPPTCVLWNPAVADLEKEFTIPAYKRNILDDHYRYYGFPRISNDPDDYSVLGLGYGKRTKSYKLLLSFRQKLDTILLSYPPQNTYWKELLVYTLDDAASTRPRRATVVSSHGRDRGISQASLYIDGLIYLLVDIPEILGFDVDDETVTTINMPDHKGGLSTYGLMQVSGRPCLVRSDGIKKTLWLLTADHQWERRCVFKVEDGLTFCPIKGVWEYNGVIFLYLYNSEGDSKLFLYDVATNKMLMENNLPYELTPETSHYSFCWGYKPSLLSPESIAGGLNQDVVEQHCNRKEDVVEAFNDQHCHDARHHPLHGAFDSHHEEQKDEEVVHKLVG